MRYCSLVVLFALLLFAGNAAAGETASGLPEKAVSRFPYRCKIRIRDGFYAIDEDLRDFPVLIRVPGTCKPLLQQLKANGVAVLFVAKDGRTILDHEPEPAGPAGAEGDLRFWVKLPLLKAEGDTVFYLYFGEIKNTQLPQRAHQVWSNRFAAVWHMHGDVSGSGLADAAGRVAACRPQGDVRPGAGKIGRALLFGNKGRFYWKPESIPAYMRDSFTLELWICYQHHPLRPQRITRNIVRQFRWLDTRGHGRGWRLIYHEAQRFVFCLANRENQSYVWKPVVGPSGNSVVGKWTHIAVVVDMRKRKLEMYVNGCRVEISPAMRVTIAGNMRKAAPLPLVIGDEYIGSLDEVRISEAARSPDWLIASYKNQAFPGKRIRIGKIEENPCYLKDGRKEPR